MVDTEAGTVLGQRHAGVRFDWGPAAPAQLDAASGCLVVVDVLSFTTAVSVAVGRGMTVFPFRWDDAGAEAFAAANDAELAVARRRASPERPWTLSPVHLARAPVVPRLVLPSPNGSTIAASAPGDAPVVAASLRNASAVARWALSHGYGTVERPLVVVASGERWPDGSLRPALEDALGAGAVLARLHRRGCPLSAEATAVALLFDATPDLAATLRSCASARQLVAGGFVGDVEAAAALDGDDWVPVRRHGAFQAEQP